MSQPTLTTKRLILRPFAVVDGPAVRRLAGSFAVADTTSLIPHPYPEGAAEEWIRTHESQYVAGTAATFAVVLRTGEALIGAIGLIVKPAHDSAELGYWIGESHWNQGYATEAGRAVLDFGFRSLRLHRIHAYHFTRNPASGRVLQKLEMQLEGVHRGAVKKWDRYEDAALYGILAQEWPGP